MACQNSVRNIERAAWSNLISAPWRAKYFAAKHVADPIARRRQNGDVERQNQAPHHRELVLECEALLGRFEIARAAQMPFHKPDSRNVNRDRYDHSAQRAEPGRQR